MLTQSSDSDSERARSTLMTEVEYRGGLDSGNGGDLSFSPCSRPIHSNHTSLSRAPRSETFVTCIAFAAFLHDCAQ
jgi:hypothetical protein